MMSGKVNLRYFLRLVALSVLSGLVWLFVITSQARAYDQGSMTANFISENYSREELKIIQAGLALNGNYVGLIDGKWGAGSADALNQFANSMGEPALNYHAALLSVDYIASVRDYGWQYVFLDVIGLSILVPIDKITSTEESEYFVNFVVEDTSLGISINIDDGQRMANIHEYAETQDRNGDPYTLRKSTAWITAYRDKNNNAAYVRSNPQSGYWGTIFLFANDRESNLLGLISSSITRDASAQMRLPEGGFLASLIEELIAQASNSGNDQEISPPNASNDSSPKSHEQKPLASEKIRSTGTGFYVSADGNVLTNAHVVKGCTGISSGSKIFEVIDISNQYDLAILNEIERTAPTAFAKFASNPARLNSDITVVGYPLTGILGGLNVTRGSISSLSGLGGDEEEYQVTAPVQAGNSGGPVLDSQGNVVAVVVAKIREDVIAQETGDIPQNINFAIKGEIAKSYLFTNGIEYLTTSDKTEITAEDLAEDAQEFTLLLECH